jgi:polyphosphate kinase
MTTKATVLAETVASNGKPKTNGTGPEAPMIDLHSPSLYINRELSTIEFNRRVLDESMNPVHPLLERLKYIAIYGSNMDEFFMVRVSGLKQQVKLQVEKRPADGLSPREQLVAIHRTVTTLAQTQMNHWRELKALLEEQDITILDYETIGSGRKRKLRNYFEAEIFPVLTPLAFDPGHPFPHISNLSLNLAVVLKDPDNSEIHFARVKVPSTLPRLVPLKQYAPDDLIQPTVHKYVWVEQLIAANLDRLFSGMEIVAAYPFRVTRNTDMEIQEEEADDLLLTIEGSLRQRHFGNVVRLEINEEMPEAILDMLVRNLKIGSRDVYAVSGPLGLSCLWELHKVPTYELKDKPYHPRFPAPVRTGENLFDVLHRQDILLHRPYDSFQPVLDFINGAADDPDVMAIKITLYRVGPNPPIVHSLIRARENGKQVAALVELKARFDEESNIEWARALENAGVHVVYGLIGLKTHAKICLVIRREREGIRRYLHLATGNYNASTARLYTDLDMLTADEQLCADASELFNQLTGYSKQKEYRKFLVAPVSMRRELLHHIVSETALGKKGYIFIACNSLVDPEIIRALYCASQAGVKIDGVVRGICCLRPGIKDVSENIRIMSIVGRFLEHPRIYYFGNGGESNVFVGSADLMPRNIDRRVEVVFPVEDPILKAEIIENIIRVKLQDRVQSHELQSDGTYVSLRSAETEDGKPALSSQTWFMDDPPTYQQIRTPDV